MSTDDDNFLAAAEPLDRAADWLARVAASWRALDDPDLKENSTSSGHERGPSRERWVFVVEPNAYGEIDPEPEEVSGDRPLHRSS